MTPTETAFLIDDRLPLPKAKALDGFAFSGADMIIGSAGLTAWEAANGSLPMRSDGCYILLCPGHDGLDIATDAAGYRHLFYWRDGTNWAVSESFLGLVAHLRARGIALEEDRAQSAAWLSRRQLFQQLVTRKTAVKGIALLGRDECLTVGSRGLGVTRHLLPKPSGYPAALRTFLETWLSRCLTLHRSPDLALNYHLSGGIDSRAVSAFRIYLERRFGPLSNAAFRSLDDDNHRDDFPVAEQIAQLTGLPLNTMQLRPSVPLGTDRTLARWERDAVGSYAPVRLAASLSDPRDIALTGCGGGSYKIQLSPREVAGFRRIMRWVYGWYGRGDRRGFMADLDAEWAHLAGPDGDPGHMWNMFSRASRSRFHGGQTATYKTQVSPFDSLLAESAADSRPPQNRLRLQFHFDVLASLAPDLLDVPFDDKRKAPSAKNRAALTQLQDLSVSEGQVWGCFEPAVADPMTDNTALRTLVEQIAERAEAIPPDRVNRLFRRDIKRVTRAVRAGQSPHPVKLRNLHNAWLLIRLAELGVL